MDNTASTGKRMNIWIFNHYANAPGSSGVTRHFDLAKELVKKGHNVTIFASSFDHQTRKEKYIFDSNIKLLEQSYQGVRFMWVKTPSYSKNDWRRVINIIVYTYNSLRVANSLKEPRPNIIIGSLMHPLAPLLAYYFAKRHKSKFYFEERDLWPQSLIDLGKVSPKNPLVWMLGKLELFLYKRADKIIVLFDKVVDYVGSKGINTDKVLYLPNGVDLALYKTETEQSLPNKINDQFDRLSGKFIGIYTGAHGLANNLDSLLDTAKILLKRNPNIHLVLVGDGPEKERLINRAEKERIDNITFLPSISKDNVPLILKKADIGLITMWDAQVYKWGFSLNKSYDYMAASLPIVLKCNIANILDHSGAVLRVENSTAMADAIEKLYSDKVLLEKMGKKSKKYVEDNHSWHTLASKLESILINDHEER